MGLRLGAYGCLLAGTHRQARSGQGLGVGLGMQMKPPLPQWALAFTTRDCKEASVPGRWGNAVGMGHVRSCAARLSPFTALGCPTQQVESLHGSHRWKSLLLVLLLEMLLERFSLMRIFCSGSVICKIGKVVPECADASCWAPLGLGGRAWGVGATGEEECVQTVRVLV